MRSEASPILVPMTFDGVEVLVQASAGMTPGTEQTSAADKAAAAFQDAEAAIRAIAESVARTVSSLSETAAPSAVEVEFGIGVTVSGSAVLVAGSSEASLSVRLSYDCSRTPA